MTDKFIAVANKQEADRAAKYLESLGYKLEQGSEYNEYVMCLSTACDHFYYYTKASAEWFLENGEEQLSVPTDFEPTQEHKEEYVLSGLWQYYDNKYEAWEFPSHFAIWERQYLSSKGYQTRDLYIKA